MDKKDGEREMLDMRQRRVTHITNSTENQVRLQKRETPSHDSDNELTFQGLKKRGYELQEWLYGQSCKLWVRWVDFDKAKDVQQSKWLLVTHLVLNC